MFENLYDAVSFLFSHWWPTVDGTTTAVDVERIPHARGPDSLRLAVAYQFSIGGDGPYTGESLWHPVFCEIRRVRAAKRKLRVHQHVLVRYRPDDPSVNRLDRREWRRL